MNLERSEDWEISSLSLKTFPDVRKYTERWSFVRVLPRSIPGHIRSNSTPLPSLLITLKNYNFLPPTGTLSLTLWAIIRYLLSSGENTAAEAGAAVTSPARKAPPPYYGTMDEEEISKPREERGFSSDDLYDGKICVICYEFQRNCFFTPCGHYVTCSLCAKRFGDDIFNIQTLEWTGNFRFLFQEKKYFDECIIHFEKHQVILYLKIYIGWWWRKTRLAQYAGGSSTRPDRCPLFKLFKWMKGLIGLWAPAQTKILV